MVEREPRALAERFGPHGVLALVFAFMLWVRMRPVGRVITDSAVYFSGNDPWYHRRMVNLAIRHFPGTTDFDPWSYFPYGTGHHSGFGGLFDQIIAFAALVLGLGDPSMHLTDVIIAVSPAVFGALTVVPTYVIARRVTDRWFALAAAGLLALASGGFLSRTIVGSADHQAAESLFGTIAVVGFTFAVMTAYQERPTREDVLDRNWAFLRRPALAGVLGGVAIASYLALWSPGVMLMFTFGVYVVLQLVREHLAGDSTESLTFATVTTMATVGVLMVLYARTYEITAQDFSLLQPLVAFGLAVGALGLYGLSDGFDRRGVDRRYYPVAVLGLIVVAVLAGWLVYPRSIDLLRELFTRIYSFGAFASASTLTVQEIRPATVDDAFRAFGAVFALAVVGLLVMAYRVLREDRPVELLVVLWSLTMLSAYFSMIRFGYYLAVNVAVLAAFFVWWVSTRVLDLEAGMDSLRDVELYQVIGLVIILMLIVPGNVVAMADREPVWDTAPRLGGTDQAWYDSLGWMQSNTPTVELEYYGQYERPPGGDYAYPESAYGVMSWWDYGHWITVRGQRIPYANPFQEGQIGASLFLQAPNETMGNLLLDAQPAMEDPDRIDSLTMDELQARAASREGAEATENGRYVVIDDQMAGGKFGAIVEWAGPVSEEGVSFSQVYYGQQQFQIGDTQAQLVTMSQRYDDTMMARLYFQDAQQLAHYRLVHESSQRSSFASVASETESGYESVVVHNVVTQPLFNAVQARSDLQFYDVEQESRVKVYERVPGATITGSYPQVESGTSVFAFLQLKSDTGRNVSYFTRTQVGPDGSFEMTVPYATDDTVGPAEGGTNTSVRATGEYSVVIGQSPFAPTASGTTAVPETAIYEGREVQVAIEPSEPSNETATNGTAGNESAGSLVTDPEVAAAGS